MPTGNIHQDQTFYYQDLADGSVQITRYVGKEAVVKIPATYKGKKVSAIAEQAFKQNNELQELWIQEDVTFVGNDIFTGSQQFAKMQVPAKRSAWYVKQLDASVLGKDVKQIVMEEGNCLQILLNQTRIDESNLQQGMLYQQKKIGDHIEIALSYSRNETYQYKNGTWQQVPTKQTETLPYDQSITWEYQDATGQRTHIASGPVLQLEINHKEDAGAYKAMSNGVLCFQLQLDVIDDQDINKQNIPTGSKKTWHIFAIVLGVTGIYVYRKRRKHYSV
ncbi:hypothetical protein A4S06_08250 [Erysipelotrichaceae bacterium MTC7]|nr:hypothetical protein A4S06_08250 [Erysipelotrichaceae bacterium MTC7]